MNRFVSTTCGQTILRTIHGFWGLDPTLRHTSQHIHVRGVVGGFSGGFSEKKTVAVSREKMGLMWLLLFVCCAEALRISPTQNIIVPEIVAAPPGGSLVRWSPERRPRWHTLFFILLYVHGWAKEWSLGYVNPSLLSTPGRGPRVHATYGPHFSPSL